MLNDAIACIATCYTLKMDIPTIIKSLQTYIPAKRRYNKIINGTNIIIDDYGHHPTAIKTTLAGYKAFYKDYLLIVDFMLLKTVSTVFLKVSFSLYAFTTIAINPVLFIFHL